MLRLKFLAFPPQQQHKNKIIKNIQVQLQYSLLVILAQYRVFVNRFLKNYAFELFFRHTDGRQNVK